MVDTDESNDTQPEESVSQADLFDNLKRIGELEDQKQTVQAEIDSLMAGLKNAIPQLDKGSLLFQMLSATLAKPQEPKKVTKTTKTTRKTAKRPAKKAAAKKR